MSYYESTAGLSDEARDSIALSFILGKAAGGKWASLSLGELRDVLSYTERQLATWRGGYAGQLRLERDRREVLARMAAF